MIHVRRDQLFRAAGYVLLAALLLLCNAKTSSFVDDLYISLTYARNLAAGNGMVFNLGEHVLGATSPLWTFVHAFLFLFFPARLSEPLLTDIVFSISTLGAASVVERLARRAGWGHWGLLGVAGMILQPLHIWTWGMETSLAMWLAGEMLLAAASGRRAAAGTLGGLLILARPDAGVLLVLVVLMEFTTHRNARRLVRLLAPPVAIILPLLAVAWIYYGSPLPNTLGAKRAQLGAVPWLANIGTESARHLLHLLRTGPLAATLLCLAGIIAITVSAWGRRSDDSGDARAVRCAALGIAWPVAQIGALAVMGVPFYSWYVYPLWFAMALAVAAGGAACWRALNSVARRTGVTPSRLQILSGVIAVVIAAWCVIGWAMPWQGDPAARQRDRFLGYKHLAQIADEHARDGDKVLCAEIGALGFFLRDAVDVLDVAFLVHRRPPDVPVYNEHVLVPRARPRFILESHPAIVTLTPMEREHQRMRLEKDFVLAYEDTMEGEYLVYRHLAAVENAYGVQALLELDPDWRDKWEAEQREVEAP